MTALSTYFMPYQVRWLQDQSRYKIDEKSRRIGMSYVQSYEDTLDAARADKPLDVWFSSADESAAKEYILYVAQWARILNIAAQDLGETVISKNDDIKALTVQFATGRRINALSSNPKAFRSKGGKLVLDEFAFHADQEAMWKAARPIITWGYPVRIISTYNGKGNRYYRMVSDAKKAIAEGRKPTWSLHTTTLIDAVNDGLADRILGRKLTQAERQAWIDAEREACGDEDTWQQEYMCNPIDEASAWLPWELIVACESPDAGDVAKYAGGVCFLGWDVARTTDKSVMWVDEKVGDVMMTRQVRTFRRTSFAEQLDAFDALMKFFNVRRACIDKTGLGMPIVEEAQRRWGQYRVEGVTFTGETKQHLATHGKQMFEDKRVRIPQTRDIRESHHAVRRVTTIAGNPRFDADRNEAGHADEFWAHMLALHAAESQLQPSAGATVDADPADAIPDAMRGRPRGQMFLRDENRTGRATSRSTP
jgi:phage FluMu gp28-like protein